MHGSSAQTLRGIPLLMSRLVARTVARELRAAMGAQYFIRNVPCGARRKPKKPNSAALPRAMEVSWISTRARGCFGHRRRSYRRQNGVKRKVLKRGYPRGPFRAIAVSAAREA